MFFTEKTYDFDELCNYNFHTHSSFSLCAKPEMAVENIIKEADNCGLKMLVITDHSDLGSGIDIVKNAEIIRQKVKELNPKATILAGSELSAYGINKFAESYERDMALDFRSYSCVHYHLEYWEQPEDRSPRGYAVHMLKVLEALFKSGRADNIAHPFSPCKMKFFSEEQKSQALAAITDNELGDIFEKGEKAECSWEIHKSTFLIYKDFSKRFYNIGKEVGVHFTVGTDAHRLADISTKGLAETFRETIK